MDWRHNNPERNHAYRLAYAEYHREELNAKGRDTTRFKRGHITPEYHEETLRLWNSTHTATDEERERIVIGLRIRERELTERLIAEETAKSERIKEEKRAKYLAGKEEAKRIREEEATRKREAEEARKREREEAKEARKREVREAKLEESKVARSMAVLRVEREDGEIRPGPLRSYTNEERAEALAWFSSRPQTTGRRRLPDEVLDERNIWYRIVKYRNWKAKQLADATAWLESVDSKNLPIGWRRQLIADTIPTLHSLTCEEFNTGKVSAEFHDFLSDAVWFLAVFLNRAVNNGMNGMTDRLWVSTHSH